MTDNNRFRELYLQHDDYLDRIETAWRQADVTMAEHVGAGMQPQTGGYEKIATEERALATRLIADYHDHVVTWLLPFVDELLQRELIAFADRLHKDIQEPRRSWSVEYREQRSKLDRLLGAKLNTVALSDDRFPELDDRSQTTASCMTTYLMLLGFPRSECTIKTARDYIVTQRRIRLVALKTGKYREVPISPDLYDILRQAQREAVEGQATIAGLSSNNLTRLAQRIAKTAGLTAWPKFYQSMRVACENDWKVLNIAEPTYAAWMGHSIDVSRDHYVSPQAVEWQAVTGFAQVA